MLFRIRQRLRLIFSHGKELNRRVHVENILMDVANGKRKPPDFNECMILALKLGTPKEHWPEGLKEHK